MSRPVGTVRTLADLDRLIGLEVQLYAVGGSKGGLYAVQNPTVSRTKLSSSEIVKIRGKLVDDSGRNGDMAGKPEAFGLDIPISLAGTYLFSTVDAAARYSARRKEFLSSKKEK